MSEPHDTNIRKAALALSCFASFVTPFTGSAINVALPSIGDQFHLDAVTLGWVATAYLLSSAVFLVPFGRLADIHGRRKVFTAGLAIFTAASLACALAPGVGFLIGARIAQGLGGAMVFGTSTAIITSVFPKEKRGKVLGIVVSSVYAGLTVGPLAGGLLTKHLGWPSIFLATVPLGLAGLVLSLVFLRAEWADAKGEPFDLLGSIVFGASICSLMYGFGELPGAFGMTLCATGVVGVVGFALYEKRLEFPVMDIRLFQANRVFAFANIAALINYSATFAISFLLSLYLQYAKGLDPRQAGMVLIAQPVLMAIFSPLAGRMSDRFDPGRVASAGMGVISLGLFMMSSIQRGTGLPFIVGVLILFGLGFALFSSPNTNAVMSSVDRRSYGIAAGTLGTMRLLGQMFSMGLATLVFTLVIGRVRIDSSNVDALVRSLRIAFVIFGALCFVGVFLSLARVKGKDTARTRPQRGTRA